MEDPAHGHVFRRQGLIICTCFGSIQANSEMAGCPGAG